MLYIAGAGGFGRETYDAFLAGLAVSGSAHSSDSGVWFLDDNLAGDMVRGVRVIAPAEALQGHRFTVGIADPAVRRRFAESLKGRGLEATEVRHPTAVIGPDTKIGAGCVFLANCHVSSTVAIGDFVQVNYNATVGHDAVLKDYVTVLPGANVSGSVILEEGVTVGSGAVVIQGLRVGAGSLIGAGSVVTKDVPANSIVKGVPGRW
ncbi:transferase [Arthrobacter sp. NtRootA9]|nr:transferase [Arthrobacter sp. NtRootA9]